MYSLIIPIYCNESSLPSLLDAVSGIARAVEHPFEAVFVVDGSPDGSYGLLQAALPKVSFECQLIALSRNFGSFAAIRQGLQSARGDYFAVMAADLQEPPELAIEFFKRLHSDVADVIVGTRDSREDPILSRIASRAFWGLYRRLIDANVPIGGVDVFACNRAFLKHLLALDERNSSLVGLVFWMGFRRSTVSYTRRAREHGKSAWTFRRKLKYMMDSLFAFSDLPIRLLLIAGIFGLAIAVLLGIVVLGLRVHGNTYVPGYAATMIAILFFGGLNAFGLGLIGAYVWRAFANTQGRPLAIVMRSEVFAGTDKESR